MRGFLALCAVAWLACYHPNAEVGAPCSPSGDCPDGQTCDTTLQVPTCVTHLVDAGPSSDGPSPDALPIDAAIVDGVLPAMDANMPDACGSDADCASSACSPLAGSCVPGPDVIYVTTDGTDTGACTIAAPCATLSYAITQIDGARRVVHAADGNYNDSFSLSGPTIGGSTATVVLLGANDDGNGAELEGSAGITIANVDLRLEAFGIDSSFETGLQMSGDNTVELAFGWLTSSGKDGMRATDLGDDTITLVGSYIGWNGNFGLHLLHGTLTGDSSQVIGNGNGGVLAGSASASATMAVALQNMWIVENGGSGADVGGLSVVGPAQLTELSFNTIADNADSGAVLPGADCGAQGSSFLADDNIFSGNMSAPDGTPLPDTTCSTTFSLFDSPDGAPPGAGNRTGAPAYVDESNATYHITHSSPARSAGNPAATLDHDIDGQARPQNLYDIGADEIP